MLTLVKMNTGKVFLAIAIVALLLLSAGGITALALHHAKCSSCENECEYSLGMFAKRCKCTGCKSGGTCDKNGKCLCPPKCAKPGGECQKDGTCKCSSGYSGVDCSTETDLSKIEKAIVQGVRAVCPNASVDTIEAAIRDIGPGSLNSKAATAATVARIAETICKT